MTYSELLERKKEIADARARLDKQEQEIDAKLEKAKFSQADKLLREVCDKMREIEKLGFHIVNHDYGDWMDADAFDLTWEDGSLTL